MHYQELCSANIITVSLYHCKPLRPIKRKYFFGVCADWEGQAEGFRCALRELFDIVECINGEQMSGWYFAHAQNESEYVPFAHVWRHLLAWHGSFFVGVKKIYSDSCHIRAYTDRKSWMAHSMSVYRTSVTGKCRMDRCIAYTFIRWRGLSGWSRSLLFL